MNRDQYMQKRDWLAIGAHVLPMPGHQDGGDRRAVMQQGQSLPVGSASAGVAFLLRRNFPGASAAGQGIPGVPRAPYCPATRPDGKLPE